MAKKCESKFRRDRREAVFLFEQMSASLIGRFGSSAFRRSTNAVLMSLTDSRFSSESALKQTPVDGKLH